MNTKLILNLKLTVFQSKETQELLTSKRCGDMQKKNPTRNLTKADWEERVFIVRLILQLPTAGMAGAWPESVCVRRAESSRVRGQKGVHGRAAEVHVKRSIEGSEVTRLAWAGKAMRKLRNKKI